MIFDSKDKKSKLSHPDSTLELIVNEEAKNFLKSVDGPISVITIAGKYRPGQSYFGNQLFCQKAGFTMENENMLSERGVWIWN